MPNEHNPYGVQSFHQAALDAGQFLIQHCDACGKHVYFPRETCPHCGTDKLGWVPALGTGTVYAVTTVRRKLDDGGDYNVSLVDLDEGVRMMGKVIGLESPQVRIGQRVHALVESTDGHGVVVFEPERVGVVEEPSP